MNRFVIPLLMTVGALLFFTAVHAQEYSDIDTMRIEDAFGQPGDTVDVIFDMTNTFTVAAADHRVVYDETLLDVDTVYCIDRGCDTELFDYFLTPGVINFLAYSLANPSYILPGSGPVVTVSFIVSESATPGDVTTIDFENLENSDNAWSDSLGSRLVRPQLIPGNFSITGGGINIPPVISYIGPQTVAEGQHLQFGVTAHDPDGDPLTLSASGLPPNSTFPQAQADSLVSSTFSFNPDFTQGPDTFYVTFNAADDHNNVTNLIVQIIVFDQPNDRIAISSDQGGIPGATGRPVDVLLFNTSPIYGAQFEITYDPAVIDVPEVNSTYRCTNMWFNSSEPEPGRIVVVIFSVGLDSIAAGTGPITQLVADVGNDTTFGPTNIQFNSAIEAIDSSGTTKDLEAEDGFFTVDRYGDANLDGSVNVGDCLSLVSYILGIISYDQREWDAADFNLNGSVDIGDLQDIVNFILEIIGQPQGSPGGSPVVVELMGGDGPSGGTLQVPLYVELPSEAAAVQFEVTYNPDNLVCTGLSLGDMAADMAIEENINEGSVRGVIFNLGGEYFGPASGDLVEVNFELPGGEFDPQSDISISEFKIVNPSADFMPVEIRGTLPQDYALGQNYPNPFNAGTNISFNLPRPGQVNLQVYDLLGRVVVTLQDDFMQAGGHTIYWDGRSPGGTELATGVYFYRLRADDFDKTKKMLLIK